MTSWPTSLQAQNLNCFVSDWQDQPVVLETDVMTVGLLSKFAFCCSRFHVVDLQSWKVKCAQKVGV